MVDVEDTSYINGLEHYLVFLFTQSTFFQDLQYYQKLCSMFGYDFASFYMCTARSRSIPENLVATSKSGLLSYAKQFSQLNIFHQICV